MITMYKYLQREKIPGPKGLFNLAEKGITRTNCWKLKPDQFKLEIRHSFIVRMIRR